MAMSLNELIRERKKFLRELDRNLKDIDTIVEKQQRFLKRLIARKNKVPEEQDLARLAEDSGQLTSVFTLYMEALEQGYPL